MTSCRLCGLPGKLCKSHIIPNFLYEKAFHEGTFVSITSHPQHQPRHLQTGFYEELLCVDCEGKLSRIESSVATLLRRILASPHPGKITGVPLSQQPSIGEFEYSYSDLKLFGLSIIWRCHHSRLYSFNRVDLGPHEERIKAMLLNNDPGPPSKYAMLLFRQLGSEIAAQTLYPPYPRRFDFPGLPSLRGYAMRAMGFDWIFIVSGSTPDRLNHQPFVGGGEKLMVINDWLSDEQEHFTMHHRISGWGKLPSPAN